MRHFTTALLIIGIAVCLPSCSEKYQPLDELIDQQLAAASHMYRELDKALPDSLCLRSWNADNSTLVSSGPGWWCSGFFPGSLWMLYEETGDLEFRKSAEKRTELLYNEQFNRGTHDLGFMLYISYGKGYKLTENEAYLEVLKNGAMSLASRYNPQVGAIKSWNGKPGVTRVIVDNMMNLEYLIWMSEITGDSMYRQMAVNHANTTLKNHFRKDFSTWHLLTYDSATGKVLSRSTVQGYSDSSAWARGQAWSLYGFTSMFRLTGDSVYLEQALSIARFILENPSLPDDLIPYWDYNAPGIPDEPRDVSSAAITASALIELAELASLNKRESLISSAGKIIRNLSAPPYFNSIGENGNFLLLHSVGSLPNNVEVDVPLTYADYYYLEALIKMKKYLKGDLHY